MSFSKKEGALWGGAVIIALVALYAWYGWVADREPSAPPEGSLAPTGATGGGDD